MPLIAPMILAMTIVKRERKKNNSQENGSISRLCLPKTTTVWKGSSGNDYGSKTSYRRAVISYIFYVH
jgi:hypothetical protein